MANPVVHAVSSAKTYGGTWQEHLPVHDWFDETKAWISDLRHRTIRHHAEGIIQSLSTFQPIELPTGRLVAIRRISERHVLEDLGEIPNAADYLQHLPLQDWMRSRVSTAQHAENSAARFGGTPELYLPIHQWLDETFGWMPDDRHQAIRHHSEGVIEAAKLLPSVQAGGQVISGQDVAAQHVKDDLGQIPVAYDWLSLMEMKMWMTGNMAKRTMSQWMGRWVKAEPRTPYCKSDQ